MKNNKSLLCLNDSDGHAIGDKVLNDKEIKFTVSLGLSSRAAFTSIDDILCVCDGLLYKVKDRGRNRLVRSSPH